MRRYRAATPARAYKPREQDLQRSGPCTYWLHKYMPAHPAALPLSLSCSSGRRVASAFPGFAVIGDILAVRVTLPHAGRVEDFHVQVSAPCGAHKKSPAGAGQGCVAVSQGERRPADCHTAASRHHGCAVRKDNVHQRSARNRRVRKLRPFQFARPTGPGQLRRRRL